MPQKRSELNSPPVIGNPLLVTKEVRASSPLERAPALRGETDENAEAIFRFGLDIMAQPSRDALAEVYRANISDLLKVVRFYFKGQPVIVDAFAFLNKPDEQIKILTAEDPC